jgi:hypothetical protein
MSAPDDLNLEAEKALKQAGYLWDEHLYAFRRTRDFNRQTTKEYLASQPVVITFEELYDHKLVGAESHTKDEQLTPQERVVVLEWLGQRIAENRRL